MTLQQPSSNGLIRSIVTGDCTMPISGREAPLHQLLHQLLNAREYA